jgi:hypothetical protein
MYYTNKNKHPLNMNHQQHNTNLVPRDIPREDKEEKKQSQSSNKLKQIESVLRESDVEQKDTIAAPQETTTGMSAAMRKALPLVATNEVQHLRRQHNKLGTYTQLTNQEQSSYRDDIDRAYHVSTLESKHGTERLATANRVYDMLATQIGLQSVSERTYKKYKKVNKLANSMSM